MRPPSSQIHLEISPKLYPKIGPKFHPNFTFQKSLESRPQINPNSPVQALEDEQAAMAKATALRRELQGYVNGSQDVFQPHVWERQNPNGMAGVSRRISELDERISQMAAAIAGPCKLTGAPLETKQEFDDRAPEPSPVCRAQAWAIYLRFQWLLVGI